MTAVGFLLIFAATNTFAVAAFSVFAAGGARSTALGAVLALAAFTGFVVTARIVVLVRPRARSRTGELRRRADRLGEDPQ